MKNLYFVVPATGLNAGGSTAHINLFKVAVSLFDAKLVTYKQRENEIQYLPELLNLNSGRDDESIYVVHWGLDLPELLEKLSGKKVVYIAYSTGWGFSIPAHIPIIACSRHTMSYWGRYAPRSPIFYLPCVIPNEFRNLHENRDIDVLVQQRKSSSYLLESLVPALQQRCRLHLIDTWVDDFPKLLNRSKIYLYDSVEHWSKMGASEGFGLPPLEAIACGCEVFSSVNDALGDYLDPEFNCHKISTYSLEYDVANILNCVSSYSDKIDEAIDTFLDLYRANERYKSRFQKIMVSVNEFFVHSKHKKPSIQPVVDHIPLSYSEKSTLFMLKALTKRVLLRLRGQS